MHEPTNKLWLHQNLTRWTHATIHSSFFVSSLFLLVSGSSVWHRRHMCLTKARLCRLDFEAGVALGWSIAISLSSFATYTRIDTHTYTHTLPHSTFTPLRWPFLFTPDCIEARNDRINILQTFVCSNLNKPLFCSNNQTSWKNKDI